MVSAVLILLNPFNLVAFHFAVSGLAIWGVGPNYRLGYSALSLFKVFGIPTIVFARVWVILRKWRRFAYWQQYFLSSAISLLTFVLGAEIYWTIVGR